MSRHLINKSHPLSLKSISDLAVLLSVACPFTEQDLNHILTHFSNPPDTKLEYSIAVREYLRAALLSYVNLEGIHPVEGVTPDIKIEQWKDFLMYNVKRASSTELSLEDSWQAFVQSLNEQLGIETDKGFVHMQLGGRPFEVYARRKSPSTLELGVLSSHRIETFKQLLEKEPSKFSLNSAKAISAAFWNDFCTKASKPMAMRNGALQSITEACALGHEIDFHNDEWESSRPRTVNTPSPDWFEEERLAKSKLAEAHEIEVRMLTEKQRKNRIEILSKELSDVGRLTGKKINNNPYAKPLEEYYGNLKLWKEPLTKLLSFEKAQYAHCWQIASDFVRQQNALYYQWIDAFSSWISVKELMSWCRNARTAKTQMQKFQRRLRADIEEGPRVRITTYANFQRFTEVILEWSQHCLSYAEKRIGRINEIIDETVESGGSDVLLRLEDLRGLTSSLESDWDWGTLHEAKRAARIAKFTLENFKVSMGFKGKKLEKFWLECGEELEQLVDEVEEMEEDERSGIRRCPRSSTDEVCTLGREDEFKNRERSLAEQELAEKMLAEARKLEAKAIDYAKRRQSDVIMKLLQVGDLSGIQEIDDKSYEAPSRTYLSNLKRWEKRLTKLLNLERVQNEHCWQVALDFVRQQNALYSKWPVDVHCRIGILADRMNSWCESTDVARFQVQEFKESLKAETEVHPHFQGVVDIILKWSQHCLDRAEKEKEEVNKRIDRAVESGASEALPNLCKLRDLVSRLETAWDQDKWGKALRYSWQFRERSEDFKAALRFKGMGVEQSWLEYDKEWAELDTRLKAWWSVGDLIDWCTVGSVDDFGVKRYN